MQGGVYQIRNIVTGDFYIGSSADLNDRRRKHFADLKRGSHHNTHLQNSCNKHGVESFEFSPLVYCEKTDLLYYEQGLIDAMRPTYNKRLRAESNLGIKRSAEARRNISEAHKGIKYPLSDERIQQLRTQMVGNTLATRIVYTDELREKKRQSMIGKNVGKKPSALCRQRVSENNKTRVASPETREKMRLAHLGKRRSEETKRKISEAKKEYYRRKQDAEKRSA